MARSRLCIFFLSALLLPAPGLAQAPDVLGPEEHCRDYSGAAVASFADADLEEVVRDALDVDAQEELTCELLSGLTQLGVGSEADRVVYGGTLRPSPENPFESLAGIQNLVNLRTLNIINRLITDIGPLSELENLDFLSLHTNWISDIGPLAGLTNLTQLILSENPISDLEPLRGLTNLTRLQVHGLYPYQLEHYLSFDDGRDPNVIFNGITDLGPLSGMTELRYLRIHLNRISDLGPLRGLTRLTHLRLYDNQITDISPLAGMTNLILLWIHDNDISDIGALGGMTELLQLGLADNSIADVGALRDMTQLEYLFLSNNRITDIEPLAGLRSLQVLRLENNDIRDAGPIRGLNNLRELSLARNYSLYDVQPLFANEGIGAGDELDLRFTYVSCADMDAFTARGANLLRITALNGSACPGRRLEDP